MPFLDEFLDSVRKIPSQIFLVQGNHDPREMTVPTGMTLLHAGKSTLGGFVIGGLGGSNFTSGGAPFEYADEEARSLLDALGPVDILLSHCPPYGTRCDLGPDGKSYGSVPVREYVESKKPRLVLCGHVHVARAVDKVGGTMIVNPGPLMEGNYATVKVLEDDLSVKLRQDSLRG
jgi:Icc-related predicted phosphoesterase